MIESILSDIGKVESLLRPVFNNNKYVGYLMLPDDLLQSSPLKIWQGLALFIFSKVINCWLWDNKIGARRLHRGMNPNDELGTWFFLGFVLCLLLLAIQSCAHRMGGHINH